jgi:hypothetical protein
LAPRRARDAYCHLCRHGRQGRAAPAARGQRRPAAPADGAAAEHREGAHADAAAEHAQPIPRVQLAVGNARWACGAVGNAERALGNAQRAFGNAQRAFGNAEGTGGALHDAERAIRALDHACAWLALDHAGTGDRDRPIVRRRRRRRRLVLEAHAAVTRAFEPAIVASLAHTDSDACPVSCHPSCHWTTRRRRPPLAVDPEPAALRPCRLVRRPPARVRLWSRANALEPGIRSGASSPRGPGRYGTSVRATPRSSREPSPLRAATPRTPALQGYGASSVRPHLAAARTVEELMEERRKEVCVCGLLRWQCLDACGGSQSYACVCASLRAGARAGGRAGA